MRHERITENVEISVVLCADPFIRELNREHRNQDKPTDVLSFPQDDSVVLGDIVISLDTAARQADQAAWPLASEVILLAVHGLLHLLGYDDARVDGAVGMRDKAAAVLSDCRIALPAGACHPYFVQY